MTLKKEIHKIMNRRDFIRIGATPKEAERIDNDIRGDIEYLTAEVVVKFGEWIGLDSYHMQHDGSWYSLDTKEDFKSTLELFQQFKKETGL